MRRNWIFILLAVLFTLSMQAEEGRYLVVLADGAKAPDLAAMGGQVLQQWSNHRLVTLSDDAAEELQHDSRVAYVQRIGRPASHRAPLMATSNAAAPSWTTGVYGYDKSGNIIAMGNDSFGYDRVGRLATANVQGHAQTYGFDVYGNLRQLGATTLPVETATNRLTQWTYDNAGNVTLDADGRKYSYDPLGMVTAIDAAPTEIADDRRMIYTASDERIVVEEGAERMRFRLRDIDAPRVLREWTSTNAGVLQWERDYVYAGATLVAGEVQVDQRLNPLRHYHLDHLGSIRMVTDGAGDLVSRSDYLPFGEEIPPTTAEYDNTSKAPRDPLKFTGHERDYFSPANVEGDSIDYMHARFYAGRRGRFLTVDPSASRPANSPQQWNRYAYANNNPILHFDPDGKDAIAIAYPDYRVTVGPVKVPFLGHGALVSVDSKGQTRYYEYGRYGDSKGIVRSVPVPDLKMGKNGLPTAASLQHLLDVVSARSGQHGRVEAAYFADADSSRIKAYAQGRMDKNDDPKRQPYSLATNNCGTFCSAGVAASGVQGVPTIIDPRPGSIIKELQSVADFAVSYVPGKDIVFRCDGAKCDTPK